VHLQALPHAFNVFLLKKAHIIIQMARDIQFSGEFH